MGTVLSKLHDAIVSETSQSGLIKRRTVTKKTFEDNIKILVARYQTFISSVGTLAITDRKALADRIYNNKNDSNCPACNHYINIAAECKQRNDTSIAFDSIVNVAKAIENVLANFQANTAIIFEGGEDINIHTAKLSHLAAFGFIDSAEIYIEFASNLFTIVSYEIIGNNGARELDKPLPYRYKFLEKNLFKFIQFHQSMLNGSNRTYLDAFKELVGSVNNVKAANPNSGSNIFMVEEGQMMSWTRRLFGQFSLNPFKWLGEQWNLIRNNKYVKMNAEKEDLIAHVALLQMDLAQKDPNSPEYQKLVKVIDSYNKVIAKMSQQLDKYYGPDKE